MTVRHMTAMQENLLCGVGNLDWQAYDIAFWARKSVLKLATLSLRAYEMLKAGTPPWLRERREDLNIFLVEKREMVLYGRLKDRRL